MICAWAVPDLLSLSEGREIDGDLIGAAAVAIAVALMPLAAPHASWVADIVGVIVGFGAGLPLGPLGPALTARRRVGATTYSQPRPCRRVPTQTRSSNAAIEQLTDPAALRAGQDVVMRAAPSLQRVLAAAMADGGWFDSAHQQAVRDVAAEPDPEARMRGARDDARRGDPARDARRRRGRVRAARARLDGRRSGRDQSDPDPAQEE